MLSTPGVRVTFLLAFHLIFWFQLLGVYVIFGLVITYSTSSQAAASFNLLALLAGSRGASWTCGMAQAADSSWHAQHPRHAPLVEWRTKFDRLPHAKPPAAPRRTAAAATCDRRPSPSLRPTSNRRGASI